MDKQDSGVVALLMFSLQGVNFLHEKLLADIGNWVREPADHNQLDLVASNQYKSTMSHLHIAQAKASNEPITSYAPIMCSLLMLEESE